MTTSRTLLAAGLLTAGLVVGSTAGAVAGTVITGANVKDGSLTGLDVKDASLGAKELSAGAVKTLTAPAAGAVSGYATVETNRSLAAGTPTVLSATCPSGKYVLGGSAFWATSNESVQFAISSDFRAGLAYTNGIGSADVVKVRITCGSVEGATSGTARTSNGPAK